MDDLVREWVEKAEADVRTAEREAVVTEGPSWDAVCFHAQQAVEKYLKALLQHRGIGFARTHDLAVLLRQADEGWSAADNLGESMEWLSAYAVEVRYPGERTTKGAARRSVAIMRDIRERIRRELSIPAEG